MIQKIYKSVEKVKQINSNGNQVMYIHKQMKNIQINKLETITQIKKKNNFKKKLKKNI